MAQEVILKKDGQVKMGYVGISWTVLFFGFFVPIFRKDYMVALGIFFISILLGAVTTGLGSIVFNIIIGFVYNKFYTTNLIKKGYKPEYEDGKKLLDKYKIIY